MSECPYTRREFDALTDEQQGILHRIAAHLHAGDPPAKTEDPTEEADERVQIAFNLFRPCEGCVPEEELDGEVLSCIHHKFSAILYTAKELAAEILRTEGHSADPQHPLDLWVVIDPSYDGQTRLAVIDWHRDKRPYCYFHEDHKAWWYQFETLANLANEVLRIRNVLVERVRALVPKPLPEEIP
jgi:hypothetical protein